MENNKPKVYFNDFHTIMYGEGTARKLQKLIKAGAINEFSIGYYTDEWHEGKLDQTYVRYLDKIRIAEISLVTRAANPRAILLDAKSEEMASGLQAMTDEDFDRLHTEVKNEYARRVLAKL